MSIITKTTTPAIPGSPLASIGPAATALRAIARTMINRRKIRSLAEMPDYLLKDIGLKRDDIHAALNSRDWREDPTYRLAVTASRRRRRWEL